MPGGQGSKAGSVTGSARQRSQSSQGTQAGTADHPRGGVGFSGPSTKTAPGANPFGGGGSVGGAVGGAAKKVGGLPGVAAHGVPLGVGAGAVGGAVAGAAKKVGGLLGAAAHGIGVGGALGHAVVGEIGREVSDVAHRFGNLAGAAPLGAVHGGMQPASATSKIRPAGPKPGGIYPNAQKYGSADAAARSIPPE